MNLLGTPAERELSEQEMLFLFRQLTWKEQLRIVGRLEVMVEETAKATKPAQQTECKIIPLFT